MIDTEKIKDTVDILSLIERDNEIRAMHKVHGKPIWE